MATYFPSSSNQRNVVPTMYVRDSTATEYAEASGLPNHMMMYMNYSSAGSYSDTIAGNSQQHQNCVDLPSVRATELPPSQQGMLSNLVASHTGDHVYNSWRDGRNEMFMQPIGGHTALQSIGAQMRGARDDLVRDAVSEDPQQGLRPQLGVLDGGQNMQGQGLSLSLSTQFSSAVPVPSFQFRHPNAGLSSFLASHPTISGEGGSGAGTCRDEDNSPNKQSRNADYYQPGFQGGNHDAIKQEALNNLQGSLDPKQMHLVTSPYGLPGFASSIPNSKYLKATQQLLDEVVNVRKALKQHEAGKHQGIGSKGLRETDAGSKDSTTVPSTSGIPTDSQEQTSNSTVELSPGERQDLQNKLTKLLSMLDEVDRRYRQYYHQMQIVVSSFDVIAGCGAAKPYTALALETISQHFRCLRDAISGQIKATRKSLGEQDTTGNSKGGGISRLRFVDQQLRQQRALQQLGMMQQHAWRPQRGLPESSVSILRAWLFEHFLHPYPKDSDKIMLARQTGLTRSQVSNWFINARVRLWKPMVEEMYKEEFGDIEMDSISSSDNASKSARDDTKISEDGKEELQQNANPSANERCQPSQFHDSKGNSIPDVDMSGTITSFQNRPHCEDDMGYMGMRLRGNQNHNIDHSNLLQDTLVQSDGSGTGRFLSADAYHMAELGRFGSGDGVSLTLGLQHRDGTGMSMSGGTHSNFVTMRGDEMYAAATSLGPDTTDYDCMDPDDRRHRFSSSHMLHDFVA
ncbi:Bel1-like homeodomain protein [Thalictrum thalictroides]|uniref:Bel1-like homeodomain protein n=1 Tax=Thalictrum thalictroides TaxID=46969 RepID=A0A7J6W7F1_THATH|nr:Bel1-like homeodomain protein [Thalictrum thalictroides]